MTDAELSVAAQKEFLDNAYWGGNWKRDNPNLYRTIMEYIYGGPRPPDTDNHYGQAMILLEDLVRSLDETPEPVPGDKLTWSPPTLSSPMTVTLDNTQNKTINGNGGDILVTEGGHRNVPFGQTQTVTFTNYRHLIMRACRHTLNAGPQDDGNQRTGMVFTNSTGHTFLEGVLWDGAPLRAFIMGENMGGATLTLQNCRVEGTRDNRRVIGGNFQHSDVMMCWSKKGVLQLDRCTFEYDNTGFAFYDGSTVANQGPHRFDARRVNMRHIPTGSWFGNVFYHAVSFNTRSTAVDCWATTNLSQYTGGNPKALQDAIGWPQLYPDPTSVFVPYRITRPSNGAVLDIPNLAAHNAGGTTNQMGRVQGDYIERQRPEMQGERWSWGVPPDGDFVKHGVAGPGYRSPGYV